MFLIKLKIIGNVIITDLDGFTIGGGTNEIIDLEDFFESSKIKKSMTAPEGALYQLIAHGALEQINPNGQEYKKYCINKKSESKTSQPLEINKKTIEQILKELYSMKKADCIEVLEREYFADLNLLDRIYNDDRFPSMIKKIVNKLRNNILDSQIDEKFVVL